MYLDCFELQYEWTPPLISFCGYRVFQLLRHDVEETHDIKRSQKIAWTEILLISGIWF